MGWEETVGHVEVLAYWRVDTDCERGRIGVWHFGGVGEAL